MWWSERGLPFCARLPWAAVSCLDWWRPIDGGVAVSVLRPPVRVRPPPPHDCGSGAYEPATRGPLAELGGRAAR